MDEPALIEALVRSRHTPRYWRKYTNGSATASSRIECSCGWNSATFRGDHGARLDHGTHIARLVREAQDRDPRVTGR